MLPSRAMLTEYKDTEILSYVSFFSKEFALRHEKSAKNGRPSIVSFIASNHIKRDLRDRICYIWTDMLLEVQWRKTFGTVEIGRW